MENKYELTIKVVGGNVEENATIADPFGETKTKNIEQDKIDNLAKNTLKAVAIRSAVSVVHSYTATLGSSDINDTIALIEGGVGFVAQTAVLAKTAGAIGVALSLIMQLPNIIGNVINYGNNSMLNSLAVNKGIRRAGVDFNRSRLND